MATRKVLIEVVLEGAEADFEREQNWSDRIAKSVYRQIHNKFYFETQTVPPVGRQRKHRTVMVGGWIEVKAVLPAKEVSP